MKHPHGSFAISIKITKTPVGLVSRQMLLLILSTDGTRDLITTREIRAIVSHFLCTMQQDLDNRWSAKCPSFIRTTDAEDRNKSKFQK